MSALASLRATLADGSARHADALGAASIASFTTAHWFVTTDHILHFIAAGASIASGVACAAYYTLAFIRKWRAK